MSIRANPVFKAGRPTLFLILQWAQKGALQPLQAGVEYVERDGTAKPLLRQRWAAAFPSRGPLPSDALVDRQGLGTDAFWAVFS